jgi:uncharacterized membrane protein (DUF485 family)
MIPSGSGKPSRMPDWEGLAKTPEFIHLLKRKRRFVIPATVFFVVYYFSLPVLVGYFPQFMSRRVWGPVNLAYLFALSQFVMAWVLAGLYVRWANHIDRLAHEVKASGVASMRDVDSVSGGMHD